MMTTILVLLLWYDYAAKDDNNSHAGDDEDADGSHAPRDCGEVVVGGDVHGNGKARTRGKVGGYGTCLG